MSKRKKQRRINPEKSNKMIYAVAGGLVILIISFVLLLTVHPTPRDKRVLMTECTAYLRQVDEIRELQINPEENRLVLRCSPSSRLDFNLIVRSAAVKLAREIGRAEVVLLDHYSGRPILTVRAEGDRVTAVTAAATPPGK